MAKYHSSTSLHVARLIYILISVCAGMAIAYQMAGPDKLWLGSIIGIVVASFFVLVENLTKTYTIRGFSTGTFGLLIGLFCAWLFTKLDIPLLITNVFQEQITNEEAFILAFNTILFSSLGFLGTVIALRSSQDDFAVVIPYVRFRQDARAGRPLLLDGDVITDGRLPSIMESGFLEKNLVIPRFVLDELQIMANSPSPGRRQRGQRGLESLEKLQKSSNIKVTIHDSQSESSDDTHDAHLLQISRILNAKILTVDDNLAKVARLQSADVLNLTDIEEALKPTVDIGTKVNLALVRTGKEDHQGVGYLPDGTMIVVNHAVSKIGSTQNVTVISTINTTAGLMVFADLDEGKSD